MQKANFQISLERPEDEATLSRLSAMAFGPGRFARTAYRIREGVAAVPALCLTAWADGALIGGVRFTPVAIGGKPGALLLGPLVIDPGHAGQGFGRGLVGEGLSRAREQGFRLVLLVGDLPYYSRMGFSVVPPGQIALPGPVDPARLLAAELEAGALGGFRGLLRGAETR
jgi:predicted N-acetyltransferase YhbS